MNHIPQILVAVLNSLWQASIVAALVWATLRLLARTRVSVNAATRYVIWWATLAVVLLLPAAPPIVQAFRARPQPAARTIVKPAPSLSLPASTPEQPPAIVVIQDQPSAIWPLWILALWAAVFLFRMTQIARSFFYLRGVKRRSSIADRELPAIARPAKLLLSNDIASPMAVGFLPPAVILPASLPDQLETSQLEHVLLHEAAHLARRDDWTNLAARVLGAALALHPVAVWILRQIEREREMACDDWVVARTGAAKPYAASLARMFELRWSRRKEPPHLKLASGIFGGASIGDRIEALLKHGGEFSSRPSPARVIAGAAILLLLLIAGSRAPRWITFAQGRPSFETAFVTPFVGSTRIPPTFQDLPDGQLVVTGYPLQNLIAEAWGIPEERIEGRRDWMNSARFSITAQASGNPDKGETRRMLKTLLEDKFKVKVHTETREVAVYIMTVAQGGLKLEPWNQGNCVVADLVVGSPNSPKYCGTGAFICNERCRWNAKGIDMAGVVDILSTMMRAPLIDETGLKGRFDIGMEWSRQDPRDTRTLSAAMEERLGLTLTPATRPIDFLILDQVEDLDAQ
jgi:uncharacterized protein (TIGR03435 family)